MRWRRAQRDGQRPLRGHDPPPPRPRPGDRVPSRARARLRRPRRAAVAARRRGFVAPGPGRRALPPRGLPRRRRRAARGRGARRSSPSASARRRPGPSACSRSCARSATASTRSRSTTASTESERARRRSSPRSPTRRGASGTRTCIPAGAGRIIQGGMDKALHVSPFMEHGPALRGQGDPPAATLSVHISSHQQGERAFDATLALRPTRADLAHARGVDRCVIPPARCGRWSSSTATHSALWLRRVPLVAHPGRG